MTTDHSELIRQIKRAAELEFHRANSDDSANAAGNSWLFERCARALEALATARTITIDDTAVEAFCADLYTGWADQSPVKQAHRERVRKAFEAASAAQNPEGDTQ